MQTANRPVEVEIVLLLSDTSVISECTEAVWPAMTEVAKLYEPRDPGGLEIPLDDDRTVVVQPQITRHYVGPEPLADVASELPGRELAQLLTDLEDPAIRSSVSSDTSYVDQRALVALCSDALNLVDAAAVVVVTDRPIQPPSDFRYLIWDRVPGGCAMSFATLDPLYWGLDTEEADRPRIIKRRTRAALASMVGTILGLVRCENPLCFLYGDVDRVSRLDQFVRIGEEHRVPALTGRGFPEETSTGDDPDEVVDVAEEAL